MKRIVTYSTALAALAALALAAPALAGPKGPGIVKVSSSSLGKILVNGSGRTLYMFTKDRRNKDRCVSVQGCTGVWVKVEGGLVTGVMGSTTGPRASAWV